MPGQKRSVANTIETELEPNTKKATEHADESTNTAARASTAGTRLEA
ncbi:hypothetical protein [Streptomyces sp. NPDC051577]